MTPRRGSALVWAAIVLASLNLRTAVSSVGPLLDEVSDAVGLSSVGAGLLTSLPVVAFAVMGATAAPLARRFGEERALTASLLAMVAGVLLRALSQDALPFLLLSALALVGGAVGNVVMPALVKRWFPAAVGPVSAAYATALALGATLGAAASAPVADAVPGLGWRAGVAVWALPAAGAAVLWLLVLRLPRPVEGAGGAVRTAGGAPTRLLRDPTAWALAVFFAAQSTQAYIHLGWFATFFRDQGTSAAFAGAMVAVVSGVSMLMSVVVPPLAARMGSPLPLVLGLVAAYVVGYAGMLVAPVGLPALGWSVLVGVGSGSFPLALVLIGLLSRTSAETSRLSAFVQSAGYAVAGVGPVLFGVLFGWTGGWAWSFAFLAVALALQVGSGVVVSRARAARVVAERAPRPTAPVP